MIKRVKSFLFENKSDKQTIMKNTFWLMLAEGVSKWGIFFITVLIARMLWPEQFWVMNFVMSFVAMFIVITDFWLTTLMVREVSRDHSKVNDYLVNLSFLKIVLWIITFWIVWIVSQFIWKDDLYITLILIYCWYSIVFNFGEFVRAIFRPSEMMQYEALLKIINWVLMLVIVLYALFTYGDLVSIMYAYLISGVLSLIVSLVYVGRKFEIGKIKLDKELIKNNLKSWWYMMWWLLFVWIISNTDKLILWFYWFDHELWIYSAANRLMWLVQLVITIYISSTIPNILKKYSLKKINKVIKHILLFTFIPLFSIIFFWDFIINIIYWKEYIAGKNILILFFISLIFLWVNTFFYTYLNSTWYEKKIFHYTIITWILNILLNIILIPIYWSIWAVSTVLIWEITMCAIFLTYFRNKIFVKNNK